MASKKTELDSSLVGRHVVRKYHGENTGHLWEWTQETKSAEIVAVWLDEDRAIKVMLTNDAGELKEAWLTHFNLSPKNT